MDKAEFQKKLVHLWMTTDDELTAPIVAKRIGVGAADLKLWLKELIASGDLSTERNAANQLTFVVPKKPRAAQIKRLKALKAAQAAQNAAAPADEPAQKAPPPSAADKQRAAAERKRRTQEAAESLESEPLTASELEKLAMLQASVDTEIEAKRAEDAKRAEEEARRRAEQEAKRAAAEAAVEKKDRAKGDDDKRRGDGAGAIDKVDLALALYEATSAKPAKREQDNDGLAEQPEKRGLLSRIRSRFGARDAIEVAKEARQELDAPKERGEKSILFSGGVSLLLGPLGWNYAGSFREAVPASVVWLGAAALVKTMSLFSFILLPAFFGGMALSSIIGMIYAWQYNKHGKRMRLLGDGDDKTEDADKDGKSKALVKAKKKRK